MTLKFIRKIFQNTIYIKFSSEKIHIRYVEKKETIDDEPVIAIKRDEKGDKVVAVGKEAREEKNKNPDDIKLYNAFKHPRTFVGSFEIAEAILRYFICKLIPRRMCVAPLVIFHPTENIEGGVTQIERRGLVELGSSIGGRRVYVWTGRNLTDRELLDETFLKTEDRKKQTEAQYGQTV